MNSKLYHLMDWPEIEGIVYADTDEPQKLLGGHICKEGFLIQTFRPDAVDMQVYVEEKQKAYPMEKVDEAGYFAALIPGRKEYAYHLVAENVQGKKEEYRDAYSFASTIDDKELKKFHAGNHYEIYRLLGSHTGKVKGVEGTRFAVWAPNASRVSVVGDFCHWDGRVYPMMKHPDSGVFELFIPGVGAGDFYKYEIRDKRGKCVLKADPYANYAQKRPDNASIVYTFDTFAWEDSAWIAAKEDHAFMAKASSIYELHLGSFKKQENGNFLNYRELAPLVIDYVKEMGYTDVELMPIMEHPLDASWGYQVTGYYAPTSRYGTPDDFKHFVNELHKEGIGVILDWVPAHFPKDEFGLARFDGAALYEYADSRKGEHPDWGTLVFDYARPEVKNFLIANALMWLKEYHADGLRMDAVASMLYLDYGRGPGQWVPNIYGGKENLEAIDFIRELNKAVKKYCPHALMIAEESTAWSCVTGDSKDGLGFDYKWNMGWMNDFLSFMKVDPLFRKGDYNKLIFSMIYNYSENFLLVLSHDEVVHGKGSMLGKMPGDTMELKLANLRAAYGYMFTHPGKKLLFMAQDFAQLDEWNENDEIQWKLLDYDAHQQMNVYVKALNKLYRDEPALHELDYSPKGFEWVNNFSADETILVFLRKAANGENLLIVANFTPVIRRDYKVGMPFAGKCLEIFNSDSTVFGGGGNVNTCVRKSEESECDGRDNSVLLTVPPLGIAVFRCIPYTEEELIEIDNAKKERQAKEKRAEAKRLMAEAMRLEKEAEAIEKMKRSVKKTGGEKSDSKRAVQPKRKVLPKSTK